MLQYYIAVVARVHGQRTVLHGVRDERVWVRASERANKRGLRRIARRRGGSLLLSRRGRDVRVGYHPSLDYFVYDRYTASIVASLKRARGARRMEARSRPGALPCFETITDRL